MLVDLTRLLTSRTLSYPGDRDALTLGRADPEDPTSRACWLAHLDLHAGTHMDAPLHFVPGANDISRVGPLVCPAVVIRTRVTAIPASALPDVPLAGCAVLFDTGWTVSPETQDYFRGYPYLSAELARDLAARGVAVVGIDTPSVDPLDEGGAYPAHRALLGAGVPVVEGLCHLDRLPAGAGSVLFGAYPLKLEGADGAPVRAVAQVGKGSPGDSLASE